MIVYWDLVAAWSFAIDYLLLLGTLRLARRPVRRGRLALGAGLGAACAVAALKRPFRPLTLLAVMALMCLAAFGRKRLLRLTLLFLMLACALGGGVVLLGGMGGSVERLARSVLLAELPWGVFLTAASGMWLLLTFVFRGGARHTAAGLIPVRIEHAGASVAVTLLQDTGNALTDPLTGEGVPVIDAAALAPLNYTANTALHVCTVGGGGVLSAFRCDRLIADGRDLGARLVAVAPSAFGGRYQGLWYDEEREASERHELEAAVG